MKKILVHCKLAPGDDDVRRAVVAQVGAVDNMEILKKSIDARRAPVVLYTVAATVADDARGEEYNAPTPLHIPRVRRAVRPIVVGLGPAGLFAALILARAGLRPLVLERGKPVDDRAADIARFFESGTLLPDSNVQFGEGGAGTFSDGKINTGIKSPYIRFVTETFVQYGAPPEILYDAHPHIGSDRLPAVVRAIREEIIRNGGEVRFQTTLKDIALRGEQVCAAVTGDAEIETDTLLLGLGHSARDTFSMLEARGVHMIAKPFSVGVRIEHPREVIDAARYGKAASKLPAADYRLVCHLANGQSVYSFCMCPGGYVVPAASESGGVVTNGYSLYARDGENSNSALLVGVTPAMFGGGAQDGIALQRSIETAAFAAGGGAFRAPCQRVGDFLAGRPSDSAGSVRPTYARGVAFGTICDCLPSFVTNSIAEAIPIFARQIRGFDMADALLTAPETRSSAPLRIVRDESGESNLRGVYPIGEGSGYAGGIMSSAVDGIRAAMTLIQKSAAE